jgi:hypothetical protein
MSTHKGKDGAPEGYKPMPKATDDDSDVEGHRQPLGKDGAPEGYKPMPKATGDEDDVEGHGKHLPL